MKSFRPLFWPLVLFVTVGCSMFDQDDEVVIEPTVLTGIQPEIEIEEQWSAKVGDGTDDYQLHLEPATDGSRLFVAAHNGEVAAFDVETGERIWLAKTHRPLSGGPGVGHGIVVIGSNDGDVIALAATDGTPLWHVAVSGEVLAAPVVGPDIVVVRSVDGRLHGLSSEDGSDLWVTERRVPRLSLRGSSSPVIIGDTVVSGFDNGQVVGVRLETGEELWETTLSVPTGNNPLDQLVDIDADLQAVGQDVYAVSYQGKVALLSSVTGDPLWTRELSSHAGIGATWTHAYVTDADSEVIALSRATGAPLWTQNAFRFRSLSAPAPYRTSVVIGDFDGYLHWLSGADGRQLGRVRVGRAGISATPLVVNDTLYVVDDEGRVAAFRATDAE